MIDKILLRCISSAKSTSSHFFLFNHQGQLYQQTHNTFAVKKFRNKVIRIYPLVMDKQSCSTLTPILSNIFARRTISVPDRHFTCQCFEKTERVARHYKKNKKKQDFKVSPGIRHNLNFANYFFQNKNFQNFV